MDFILKHESPRILVVEDDPVALKIVTSALDAAGYEYAMAANGQEAIDRYSDAFFPIIITDWMMPEMDGLELCRLIRTMKINRYIYIILMTCKDSRDDLINGLEAGADEYIVKPVNHAELRARLNNAIRILDLEANLKRSLAEISELSIRDPLTGAFNRGYMDHQLLQEVKRSQRYVQPLSILMCDLDHFKKINDDYGHQAGDEILKACVIRINESVRRGIDWVSRYGGEEFLIVLPETDFDGCAVVAERIRQLIALNPVDTFGCEIDITASFGAVTITPTESRHIIQSEQFLHQADKCLYQAKNSGRNRVVAVKMEHGTVP